MSIVVWYSLDPDLEVRNHEAVGVEAALRLLDRYVSEIQPVYEMDEAAIAASTFGLSRGESEFIEFHVNASDEVLVRVDLPNPNVPRLLRPWFGIYEHIEYLPPSGAAERIRQFYDLPAEEFRLRLRHGKPPRTE